MLPLLVESQTPVPPHHITERKPAFASQIALTDTASIVVALAAQQAGRPDLIRSPKRVLAHLWEKSEL